MLTLYAADSELTLTPDCGGGIAVWRWQGHDIFRPGDAKVGPLGLGSFPLVPFSNRIVGGRFTAGDAIIRLPANLAGGQTIHGFGWQAQWKVVDQSESRALLRHVHDAGDWPCSYCAEQDFDLAADGLVQKLALTNLGETPMPAGLGIHPYFPRTGARLDLPVTGMWDVDADTIPTNWLPLSAQPDWFGGAPIDHGFTGCKGAIHITWPTHALGITPDLTLGHTVVYVPPGADYFCVEPVSHMTNALNRHENAAVTGVKWLDPGEAWECRVAFAVNAR